MYKIESKTNISKKFSATVKYTYFSSVTLRRENENDIEYQCCNKQDNQTFF